MKPWIIEHIEALGYDFFEGNFDLNIIGERRATGTNVFDDVLHVCYKVGDLWQHEQFACTTDPGLFYLQNPSRVQGTAILKEGQYKSSHTLGLHKGRYKALVQQKPLQVYRDRNKDDVHDMNEENVESGLFGINIHKAGNNSQYVSRWSAGCTVLQNEAHYNRFIALCEAQVAVTGYTTFSYTLISGV